LAKEAKRMAKRMDEKKGFETDLVKETIVLGVD
jgi:hypothetical protein